MMMSSMEKVVLLLLLILNCALALSVSPLSTLPTPRDDVLDTKTAGNPRRRFMIDNDQFYKDGSQFRILGGSLHYFRVHPEYWEDRLLRVKALGLNVVQTYVPWNLHQPKPDQLNFEVNTTADLEGFLKIAQRLDLLVMLRPGPYICGEWDFGGFPAWLLAVEPALSLRTSDANYLNLVDSWWDILLPKIFPFLYTEGGPIIMVQIENEYGSFGKDKVYMKHLVGKAKAHLGEDIILYTTDGAVLENLHQGSLSGDDVYTSVDFPVEWDPGAAFRLQKLLNAPGKSPPLSSEFYTGWLTHWGEPLAQTDSKYTAAALEQVLRLNASVVLYMVHGGTNFGFSSGANTGGTAYDFLPDITSYDYDAPIGEAGSCNGAKFKALRAVLSNYSPSSLPDPPSLPARRAYGIVDLHKLSSLFHVLESLSKPPNGVPMGQPRPMEMLGQVSGFILYRSKLPPHTKPSSELLMTEVCDRAQVFVAPFPTRTARGSQATVLKSMYVGTFERWSISSLQLPVAAAVPGLQLDILVASLIISGPFVRLKHFSILPRKISQEMMMSCLDDLASNVENMGHVNYGPFIYDPKGILSAVTLDGVPILGWTAYPIPLENIQDVTFTPVHHQLCVEQKATLAEFRERPGATESWMTEGPSFYQGWLDVDQPADTFVSLRGWSKGVVFINGFNLGRFWPVRGPQCTLYVPAPLLLTGRNELILLELEGLQKENSVVFTKDHDFSCGSSNIVEGLAQLPRK